jgi:hypothetical protein
MTRDQLPPDELVPPACRPTVERLQGVLDGDLPSAALDADPHAAACAACRERVAAARLLASVLAAPAEATPAPPGLTDRILEAVRADRRAGARRAFALAGGLAVAAAVALVVWLRWPNDATPAPDIVNVEPGTPGPEPGPEPRPVRIGEEFSKAGVALREAPRPITEPAAAAPQVLAKVTDMLTRPAPEAGAVSPGAAIAEIPDAARAGLEPVTGTAQKAFARLLRDVGAVHVSTRPKS